MGNRRRGGRCPGSVPDRLVGEEARWGCRRWWDRARHAERATTLPATGAATPVETAGSVRRSAFYPQPIFEPAARRPLQVSSGYEVGRVSTLSRDYRQQHLVHVSGLLEPV